MAKNPRDRRRENKLIIGCRILIDIYKGKYEVRGKVNGKNVITIFRNLGPFAKPEHEVF